VPDLFLGLEREPPIGHGPFHSVSEKQAIKEQSWICALDAGHIDRESQLRRALTLPVAPSSAFRRRGRQILRMLAGKGDYGVHAAANARFQSMYAVW
jgi:hypothetical protein